MSNIVPIADLSPEDRFAIVVSSWNKSITSKLLDGAIEGLVAKGVAESAIDVAWVPGSWELPVVTEKFAQSRQYEAVLALGAVIRGETSHDQHINRAVSGSLSDIGVRTGVPVLFGLLTCETMEQAVHRSGGNVGNKGTECAEAAIHMSGLLKNLPAIP